MLEANERKVGSDGLIRLDQVSGSDEYICRVARSTSGANRNKLPQDDKALLRYLVRHMHTTPIEFGEGVFFLRIQMDAWRQMVRHRTASINEYSTRYREAINEAHTLDADEWRLQSKGNRQGSEGANVVTEWPADWKVVEIRKAGSQEKVAFRCNAQGVPLIEEGTMTPGEYLSSQQDTVQKCAREAYEERLEFGVAFEVARKDLPLSTYTELYWKCDLNNIFKFLSLRMHSHAQKEIRSYAEAMYDLLRPHFPMLFEAFDDFDPRRGGLLLSRLDIEVIRGLVSDLVGDPNRDWASMFGRHDQPLWQEHEQFLKDQGRKTTAVGERQECIEKLKRLGLLPADFVRG